MIVGTGSEWFIEAWRDLWQVPISAVAMLVVVIVVVRVVGLRSFSKMSGFDFAVTVSIGSILGSVATSAAPLVNGALATASLLGIQAIVSWARSRRGRVEDVLDNTPLLLMNGDGILEDNLRAARVTQGDLLAKLREANVHHLDDVHAVVLETTGDISVLHGPVPIAPILLADVRRRPASGSIDTGHRPDRP